MAKRLRAVRTYITPPDSAGVAISRSPIGLMATSLKSRPAATTTMSPSSFDRCPRVGAIQRMPAYAQSLKQVAKEGPKAFYGGPIGDVPR